jgi:hypothetical protein
MTSTPTRNRAFTLTTLVIAVVVLLAFSATANAGEWVQRSCSYGTEYIAPEGWQGEEVNGFVNPNQGKPLDTCIGFTLNGGLWASANGSYGNQNGAGEIWAYKPPKESLIAGGELTAQLQASHGKAAIVAYSKSGLTTLESCESPGCSERNTIVPVTVSNATMVYEWAACFPAPESSLCPSAPAAQAGVTSAQILLSTSVVPSGSGFAGTLLGETITGKGTLTFTAADAGPGVYQARMQIDGHQIWAATPSTNEGKCISTGSFEGARAFNYQQPCPSEVPVAAEVDTSTLADGAHHLTVEVEDAAGDVATVYSHTLTSANHPVAPIVLPPNRGACNGAPCEETAKLIATPREAQSFTKVLKHSAVTLTGRLTSTTGTPLADAQVKLLAQITGSSTATQIASAMTNADGSWSLKAPSGPSRLLQVAFYSHTLDVVPAATLDFHENVPATVSIHAPSRVHIGQFFTFSGQLTGGYIPAGGEEVQVQIEYGGRWRELQLVDTNSHGKWRYRYAFTLEPGTRWAFRAIAVRNGSYPFVPRASRTIHVAVRR